MGDYLTKGYPNKVCIEGMLYHIATDYRTCIKTICALEDNKLTHLEKQSVLLQLMYDVCPTNKQEALTKAILFLNCGQEVSPTERKSHGPRVYSFIYDDRYIFSAVDRVLLGRLSKGDFVHWWEFVMAFMEMPEDCVMSRIIYFRSRFHNGKLTKEEKQVYNENRSLFELPVELTAEEEEAEAMFMERLGK